MYEFISGREYPAKVIPLIEQAKHTIDIIVFDWRWYPQDPGASVQLFNQAIIRAARRGVKVRAITNNDEINKILNEAGISAKRIQTKKLMHCKLMVIDQVQTITGSHNYTQSAFQMNLELSVVIFTTEPQTKVCEYFNTLFSAT